MPRVWTRRTAPPGAVYVGRGSPYGNSWSHKPSGFAVLPTDSRTTAVRNYQAWLFGRLEAPGWSRPSYQQIEALRGKDLYCYCHDWDGEGVNPMFCHADVLLEISR